MAIEKATIHIFLDVRSVFSYHTISVYVCVVRGRSGLQMLLLTPRIRTSPELLSGLWSLVVAGSWKLEGWGWSWGNEILYRYDKKDFVRLSLHQVK
jgi:hypothetical protein